MGLVNKVQLFFSPAFLVFLKSNHSNGLIKLLEKNGLTCFFFKINVGKWNKNYLQESMINLQRNLLQGLSLLLFFLFVFTC